MPVDADDVRHGEAILGFAEANQRLTHSYVLAEFVPLSRSRGMDRSAALVFLSDLLHDSRIEVVWVDELLHREAVSLLQRRLDKTYSLCDAVSFLLMRQRGISAALTTDRHFAQEGFVRLLKP